MPGWHKLAEQTARRLVFPAQSLWSKANPCPLEVACVEVAILHAMGELEQYSSRDLQARWGQSWRFVARALKLAQIQGVECNTWPERDTFGTHSVPNTGTPKPSKSGQLEGKSGRFRDGFGTVSGRIRDYARDPYSDPDADVDPDQEKLPPNPPPGGQAGGEPLSPSTREQEPSADWADPSRLAQVWQEEMMASPREIRGRPTGLMPNAHSDLLSLGEDAEPAVRAIATLCRGTETRAPRVLDWARLLGPRVTDAPWRDALAWVRGQAGEPALGRQWVGGAQQKAPRKAPDWPATDPHEGRGQISAPTPSDGSVGAMFRGRE